ncbi:MAG: DUF748 domain-containing protein [Candidatus Wallbacteria bacterium]|nr:DUF748 domain-containing protein [Candidatus Wallbacteria bacterium]
MAQGAPPVPARGPTFVAPPPPPRRPPPVVRGARGAGRIWRLFAALALLALIGAAAPLLWLRSQIQNGLIERQLASVLTDVLGRHVSVGAVTMGWSGGLYLDRLGVAGEQGEAPLFLLGQIRVDYSYWKLFTGQLSIDSITFVRPSFRLVRRPDGTFNFTDVLTRIATRKPKGPPPKVSVPAKPDEVPAMPVRRILFEGVDVVFEDRAVKPTATQQMKDFRLAVDMPGPNRPFVARLTGRPGTARVQLDANLYMAPLLGRIEFSARGLSLSGLDSYLAAATAKLPVRLEKPTVEADVSGWLDIPEGFLKVERGKPVFDRSLLRYGGELDVKTLRATLPGGDVSARLRARVVTGSARLEELSLALGKTTVLRAAGSLDSFTAPSFDLKLDVPELPIETVLAMTPRELLPPDAIPALSRIEPQGKLTASLRAVGTPVRPLVTGRLSATGLAVVLPACTLDLNLDRLDFTPDRLDIHGLTFQALGARAGVSAIVDGLSGFPSISLALDARSPELSELPFPLPAPAGLGGRVGLSLRAGLATARLAAANHAANLRELARRRSFAGFEPLQAALAELKTEGPRLKAALAGVQPKSFLKPGASRKPAERIDWAALDALRQKLDLPRLEALAFEKLPRALAAARQLLSARLHLELTLEKLEALAGAHPATANGAVELDLEKGFATRDLRLSYGSVPVGLELALERPLSAPALRSALALAPPTGSVPLAALAALVTSTGAQSLYQDLQVDPEARLGLGVTTRFSRAGPGFTAELFADRIAFGRAPMRVVAPALRLNATERGVEVPRTEVRLGPVGLAFEAAATRDAGARLLVRTADSAGLDLSALSELIPLAHRARVGPHLAGGRLGVEVSAQASMQDAQAHVKVRARHRLAELALAARAEDLLGTGKLDTLAHVALPNLASLAALLPSTVATRVAPFDLSKSSVDVRLTATGDLAKLVLGGQARFPGGETRVVGEVAPVVPFGRAWASLGTRVARTGELLAILPAELRDKIDRFRPEADLRLVLNLAAEKGRKLLEQTVELAAAKAVVTTRGMEIPIDLSGSRAAVRAVLLDGQKPTIDADLSGLKLRTQVKGVPILVASQGGFHIETTSARLLGAAVLVNGSPIRMELSMTDPWAERKSEGALVLDHWKLAPWVDAFVPKEKSVIVTGTASLGVQAAGRFPYMDGFAWIELAGIHVDAPQLRGLGAGVPLMRMKLTRDDIIVDATEIQFGVKRFHLPLSGSMKRVLNVPNVYRADPKSVGPLVLSKMGGVNGIKALLGEKQIERLILDQTVKVIVWLKARDYPDTYLFKNVMPPEDKARFWQQPQQIVDKHIELAKQALA